jgi:hypothetical protein
VKNYRTWIIIAIVLQFLTGLIHGIGLFVPPQPSNDSDSERQLLDLFTGYIMDMGAGYHRTLYDLFLSLSSCFTLLFLFGGLLNWYLLKKKIANDVMAGIVMIQVVIFGVCFGVMLVFAFLPPIVLCGLVFLMLTLARLTIAVTKAS